MENEFQTEDMALAAYLKMKNVELTDYDFNSNGKVRFIFADDGEACKKLHIQFLNSECKKFDSEIRDLKKLIKR